MTHMASRPSFRSPALLLTACVLISLACRPASTAASAPADVQAAAQAAAPPVAPPSAVPPAAAAPAACTTGIFTSVVADGLSPSADRATVRERLVTFDVARVQKLPATLDLNLFDDVCVTAVLQQSPAAGPVAMWTGAVKGVSGSQVTLIFNPGAAAGSIVMPPHAYQLELAREGVYRVREVDTAKYANEMPPMTPPAPGAAPRVAPTDPASPGTTPPGAPPEVTATTKAPPKKKQP